MDEMQNQINSILQNPEMMQRIKTLAQSLNSSQAPPAEQPPHQQESGSFSLPDIDLSMLQKLSGLAGQSSIDSNQRTLLKALGPYLSHGRIAKLEKAMRAAKMASMASVFLGQSGFLFNPGR